MNRRISLFLFLAFFFGLLSSNLNAQDLQDMTVSFSDVTYQEISGGTVLIQGLNDDGGVNVYFPFDFEWGGKKYVANTNTMYVNSNAYVLFSPYSISNYYTDVNRNYPGILPFKGDMYTVGEVRGGIIGSAPNRVLVIQWRQTGHYYYSNYNANYNFQVRMYETTNAVDIIYGSMDRGSFTFASTLGAYPSCAIAFTASSTNYINILPGSEWNAYFSSKNNAAPVGYEETVYASTYQYVTSGKKVSLTAFPSLVDTYPAEGAILERGNIYTGNQHPAMLFTRIDGQADVYGKYTISGPLPVNNPSFRTIYTGTASDYTTRLFDFNPQPVGTAVPAKIDYAIGIAAGANGALDLQTNANQIIGGEYMVESEMQLQSVNYVQSLAARTFVIALGFDLSIARLLNPRSLADKKYPLSTQIPVQARFTNIGLAPMNEFIGRVVFVNDIGDTIYDFSVTWPTNPPQSLTTGEWVDINFPNFRPTQVSEYTVYVTATPTNPSRDDEWSNNIFPRASEPPFQFAVAHEIEAATVDILVPSGQVYVGRPLLPKAKFKNNGVSDISDVPATIAIYKNVAPYDTIFRDNIIIQDIPSGRYNTNEVFFSSNFIPPSAGQYGVCVSVNSPDDPVTTNNRYCELFDVIDAMAGVYTIGTMSSGSRNFLTIQDALDALFLKGVTGPVTFLMTDATYNIGDAFSDFPAMDMSSKIIGVDATNTITFKPSQQKALYKGSVTINLHSAGGVGVYIAQNLLPTNNNAAVHSVTTGLKKEYANTEGYITFDGGSQKSLKFVLNTSNDFNAPFYLGSTASNNNIKNCIINTTTSSCADVIPHTKYDAGLGGFNYEENIRTNATYSTGILLRSTYPKDKNENSNLFQLDTLPNANNVISGNEIKGFGYGIVSLGIGPLFNEGRAVYQRHYNMNNLISNNEIYNVCRAGIFVGHEENTKVDYNRIYNVTGSNNNEAYGILAGGQGNAQWFGYNNINLTISGNEISDIYSSVLSGGIVVEQARNSYPFSNPSFVTFPDVSENAHIINNAVWDLNTDNEEASRVGIQIFTERQTNNDFLTEMITPKVPTYYTRNDKVVNNTVWMRSDLNGISSEGVVIGIALQQTSNAFLSNNAVAMTDAEVMTSSPAYSGFFLQGIMPENGSLVSDRNAFWTPNSAKAAYFYFIEMTDKGAIIDLGTRTDYQTLDQWQNWTGQDFNSIVGDFTADYVFNGTAPKEELRINNNPYPLGSVLNNRGNNVNWIDYDIDAVERGAAGQRYDIGHVEFDGRLFLSDIEAIKITEPVAYKAGAGFFSDAEYVMTTAPVDVKGIFRNSGNLPQNNVTATLNIYRELPNGTYSIVPELTATTIVNAATTESVEVSWNLNDGNVPDFVPQTYGDLAGLGYVAPLEFTTMEANVTPKYKIVIAIGADQNNTNNTKEKIVRFYVSKSNLRMVMSVENSYKVITGSSSTDDIAGKYNYLALIDAMGLLGWKVDIPNDQYDFDIFDRNGWEAKAVNYEMYRTMVWADAHESPLTRYERIDMMDFLEGGNTTEKKNLIIGSQEIVRQHMTGGVNDDEFFVGGILRAEYAAPGNPMGAGANNDGNQAMGVSIGRNYSNDIMETGVTNDAPPLCGLVKIYPNGEGLSTAAFYYTDHSAAASDSISGVTTATLNRNVCYYAIDWRHWGELDKIIRGTIDFIEKNGGSVVPVELVSFDAIARGKQVDLAWVTASEYNSDKFEIEKADKNESGVSAFSKIAEEKAQGSSVSQTIYGPVVDKNVNFGSTYVYRLKVLDITGEYAYSDEREVKIGGDNTSWLASPVPNPAVNQAKIDYSISEAGNIDISIYDLNGKLLRNLVNGYSNAGVFTYDFNAGELPNGQYSIVLKTAEMQYVTYIQIIK